MGYIVRMPKLGMEMQEGELVEWKAAVGEPVEADAVIAEIESEKSVADVEAREDGVLRERLLEPGDAVEPGAPMGIVADPATDITDLRAKAGVGGPDAGSTTGSEPATATGDGTAPAADGEATAGATGDGHGESETGGPTTQTGRVRASPKARRLAEEQGIDLSGVEGSGPERAVIEADVEAAVADADAPAGAEAPAAEAGGETAAAGTEAEADVEVPSVDTTAAKTEATPALADATGGENAVASERTVRERREFGGMRRTIADRLGESYRNAVHVTVDREIDVEALLHATEVADDALDADVSMPDLLLVALSEALDAHPEFNATYEDGVHTVYEDQHIGVAVDVDAGLVTPVLRGVDDLSLPEVAAERRRVTDLALDGEYTTDDLSGGTFTVSNLGVLGVDSFTPIINPPEVAIMGITRVREVPRPAEDGDGVVFRRRMTVSLSFDHRVVDGADAARFLETFAEAVASPWGALLGRA